MAEEELVSTSASPAGVVPAAHGAVSAGGPRRRGGFVPRRKVCRFCAEQVRTVDWKQFQLLRTFTSDRGKMLSSRVTGTCAKHQRQLTQAILRARHLAILPFLSN